MSLLNQILLSDSLKRDSLLTESLQGLNKYFLIHSNMNATSIFIFLKILLNNGNIGVDDLLILTVVLDEGTETLVALDEGGLFIEGVDVLEDGVFDLVGFLDAVDLLLPVLVGDLFEKGAFVLLEQHCHMVEYSLLADGKLFPNVQLEPVNIVHNFLLHITLKTYINTIVILQLTHLLITLMLHLSQRLVQVYVSGLLFCLVVLFSVLDHAGRAERHQALL
jgi:hypothetical protein